MAKLILIGCGKAKQAQGWIGKAQDLYTGSIFRARRAYAKASGCEWFIISAKYGLMSKYRDVMPYDLTVTDLAADQRSSWALGIAQELASIGATELDLHMGRDYAGLLIPVLEAAGIRWSWPVRGLGQGYQLQWYKQHRSRVDV